jgi:hypothetical protein
MAMLSVSRPFRDSPWQMSFDASLSAISLKDRHTDIDGRISAEDLKRQEQHLQVLFRRRLGPYANVSFQPGLAHLRTTPGDDTDPAFVLPPGTLEASLGLRLEYLRHGYELGLWGMTTRREGWDGFGLPGDTSLTDVRDHPTHWGLQLNRSFHLPRLDRISVELDLWDGDGLDRFSAFGTKNFPGLRIRGYDGSGLRFTRGVTGDLRYATPALGNVRFEIAVGGALFENPEYYGEDMQHAYGASLAATFPGVWGTFLRLRLKQGIGSSLPVDGSDGSIRLELFRTFDGWWPWTHASRRGAHDATR